MSKVTINIDENNKLFIIGGDIRLIIDSRRALYFFSSVLNANISKNKQVVVPYELGDRDLKLKEIQDAFEKYKIEYFDSPEIVQVLTEYYTEKENFKLFSEKAGQIWNNNVDVADFKAFKESLETNLNNRRLYDKQLLSAFHLAFSQNACNFSVPGAGKTSVVYGAYSYLKNLPNENPKHVDKLLIIGPLSSFGPWEDEYKECFGREVVSKRLSGGISLEERTRYLLSVNPIEDIPELTLMSYQSISNNLKNLSHFLQRKDIKVMLVLDEAHRIKNVDGGVWAMAALALAKLSGVKSRVVLTGTPVPNGYEDIYNFYQFIWPDKNIVNFNIFQLRDMSANRFDPRIERLVSSISPFFIRIRKSDLGLPPINNVAPILVEMGVVQREIYDFIENKYISYFEETQDGYGISAELVKARFVRLMQVSTNPGLLKNALELYFQEQGLSNDLYIDDTQVIDKILRYKELEKVPRKFEVVKTLVSELLAKNEKVIIWGTFIQNIKELQEYLRSYGIMSERLIGEVPVETDDIAEDIVTREKIIKEFHRPDSRFKVLVANPFAVAESISLHKACHNAIYLERTFNAANFIQSKDRIHRVGLSPGVITNYYYLVSANSIDETIHSRLLEKERRMLELIESRDIPLITENLNYDIDLKDDLKAIILDYVRRSTKA